VLQLSAKFGHEEAHGPGEVSIFSGELLDLLVRLSAYGLHIERTSSHDYFAAFAPSVLLMS